MFYGNTTIYVLLHLHVLMGSDLVNVNDLGKVQYLKIVVIKINNSVYKE